jgi:hypothetical protein
LRPEDPPKVTWDDLSRLRDILERDCWDSDDLSDRNFDAKAWLDEVSARG